MSVCKAGVFTSKQLRTLTCSAYAHAASRAAQLCSFALHSQHMTRGHALPCFLCFFPAGPSQMSRPRCRLSGQQRSKGSRWVHSVCQTQLYCHISTPRLPTHAMPQTSPDWTCCSVYVCVCCRMPLTVLCRGSTAGHRAAVWREPCHLKVSPRQDQGPCHPLHHSLQRQRTPNIKCWGRGWRCSRAPKPPPPCCAECAPDQHVDHYAHCAWSVCASHLRRTFLVALVATA